MGRNLARFPCPQDKSNPAGQLSAHEDRDVLGGAVFVVVVPVLGEVAERSDGADPVADQPSGHRAAGPFGVEADDARDAILVAVLEPGCDDADAEAIGVDGGEVLLGS